VEWILALQASDDPAQVRKRIRSWCARHPDHQRAWEHVEHLNRRFSLLTNSGCAPAARHALSTSVLSRRQALKALSLILVTGATGYSLDQSGMINHWRADYHTAIGEQRSLTLPQGTQITLNSNTAIQVQNTAEEQRIRLLDGEIYIATGKQQSLPLFIETAQGMAYPLGTRFALRQLEAKCRLAVYEGQVALHPINSEQSCRLNAGYSTLFNESGWMPFSPVTPQEDSWTKGLIVARAMRLEQFIKELSRYRPGILRVPPEISQLTVSGTYPVSKTDQVLQTLASALPIKIRSVTPYWVSLLPA